MDKKNFPTKTSMVRNATSVSCLENKSATLPGLEPGIFCSVGRRVIHCATRPDKVTIPYKL